MGYLLKETKVGEEKALRVLQMYAEGRSYTEIGEVCELSYAVVKGLTTEVGNKQFVDQFRKNYMARVMEVPVANKRIRLDELEGLRVKVAKLLEGAGENVSVVCKLVREMLGVLERAQNEMEVRPLLLAQIVAGYNEFGALSDEKLYERRMELLRLAQRSLVDNSKVLDVDDVND